MGWFGGGSSDDAATSSVGEKSFASDDTSNFASVAPSGGGSAASDLQHFGVGLQQQLLVQQVITDISDKAFLKCIQVSCFGGRLCVA